MMKWIAGLTILALMAATASAGEPAQAERRAILDAVRAAAMVDARQPVKIKVDRLNVDGGWAVLVGELVARDGAQLDWGQIPDCDADLDRMLWAVAAQHQGQWQTEQIYICASEPPWWYLQEDEGLIWPCGVYAGLEASDGQGTLEQQCRRQPPSATPAAPN